MKLEKKRKIKGMRLIEGQNRPRVMRLIEGQKC